MGGFACRQGVGPRSPAAPHHASSGPAVQKSNSKLVISRPESDSQVTQLGIGVGGPSSPWGLAGANESWISLQSDSDWSEINFHLKFVPPVPGNPLLKASAGLAPFTIACFYRPRQMSSSNPTQKNVCFLGMYRTKRSLQLLRQCVCMFTIK